MKGRKTWMALAGLLLPLTNLPAQTPAAPPPPPAAPQPAPEPAQPVQPEGRQMEKGAFLGVAVVPAPDSLRAQLGLPRGTGLLVLNVESGSAAMGKLQEHDVLTRFNDQILVNQDQLMALVYNAGIGTEVKITLVRQKTETTVPVSLGERELPRGFFGGGEFGWWSSGEPWMRKHEEMVREMRERAGDLRERAEQRMRDARERREQRQAPGAERGDPGQGQPEKPDPGRHPTVRHSTWVENGLILNLVESGGSKRLTVERNGEKVFEGPVDTEEQRQKVPQEFREKLDKMGEVPAPKGKADQGGIL